MTSTRVKRQVEKTAVPVPEDGWGGQAEAEFAQVSRHPGTEARAGWGSCCKDSRGLAFLEQDSVICQVGGKVKIFCLYLLNCLLELDVA